METRRDLWRWYWVKGLPKKRRVKQQGENSCCGGLSCGRDSAVGGGASGGVGLRLT